MTYDPSDMNIDRIRFDLKANAVDGLPVIRDRGLRQMMEFAVEQDKRSAELEAERDAALAEAEKMRGLLDRARNRVVNNRAKMEEAARVYAEDFVDLWEPAEAGKQEQHDALLGFGVHAQAAERVEKLEALREKLVTASRHGLELPTYIYEALEALDAPPAKTRLELLEEEHRAALEAQDGTFSTRAQEAAWIEAVAAVEEAGEEE